MALNIGKKKNTEAKAPKSNNKAEAPAPEETAPAEVPAPGDQRSVVVRGGKKTKGRKKTGLAGSSGRKGISRSGGATAGRGGKGKPVKIEDIVLRAFPTLAKALGREASATGKPQKRKKKADKPVLPIVNLLPPRFTVIRERNNAIRGFVISGLGIVFAAGTMFVIQGTATTSAQNTLNAAQGQIAEATGRLAQYGDVGSFFDQVQQRLTLEKNLKANEVDFVSIYNEIQTLVPAGTLISDITITPPPTSADGGAAAGGTICGPQADPFSQDTRVPVACVKITGSLPSMGMLTGLNKAFIDSKFLFNILFVQNASDLGSAGGILFTGTAGITADGLLVNTNLTATNDAPASPTVPVAPNTPIVPINPDSVLEIIDPNAPSTSPVPGGNN